MARGGKRPGAGRPTGAATKRTRDIADSAAREGVTPLEFLLAVMRDEDAEGNARLDAAKAAAPYVHPKLAAMTLSGDPDRPVVTKVVREIVRS